MTNNYKDNVNAYNPANWGRQYSKNMTRKLSKGAFTWKGQNILYMSYVLFRVHIYLAIMKLGLTKVWKTV